MTEYRWKRGDTRLPGHAIPNLSDDPNTAYVQLLTGLAMLASATARHTSAEQFVANVTRDLPKFIELDLVQQEIRKAEEERPVAVVIFDERGAEVGKVDLP